MLGLEALSLQMENKAGLTDRSGSRKEMEVTPIGDLGTEDSGSLITITKGKTVF